ncbi:exodeoxyribonuclease VII small subunit [Deinococcus apachensis]|uniref:exodeoxyribonuclease VII small subunit n=1 Tax=Deinococcus apachensis TaxID=309886 RepID=UPI00038039C3|nr:exodeoxyribonuclease VII small subunit [Deinococcus apachensis]
MPEKSTPLSYREAYTRLSRIAAELETGEADLDRVLPLLEEARAAYAACRERIEAVRAVLAGDWADAETGPEDEDDEDEVMGNGARDASGDDPYADPF